MKVAHYSDTHTRHDKERVEEADLFIHTGDFCKIDFNVEDFEEKNLEITYKQALNFLEWVKKYPAKHKVITSGNHEIFLKDPGYRAEFEKLLNESGIIFKDNLNEIVEVGGVRIAGAGCYPRIAKYMPLKHAYYFREGHYNSIPDEHIDILLTHTCPEIKGYEFECQDLMFFIKERGEVGLPISLSLCGHIHESRGEYDLGSTKIYNSACQGHVFNHNF